MSLSANPDGPADSPKDNLFDPGHWLDPGQPFSAAARRVRRRCPRPGAGPGRALQWRRAFREYAHAPARRRGGRKQPVAHRRPLTAGEQRGRRGRETVGHDRQAEPCRTQIQAGQCRQIKAARVPHHRQSIVWPVTLPGETGTQLIWMP